MCVCMSANQSFIIVFLKHRASMSDSYNINLEDGDYILFATDGLYDNMYLKDILENLQLSKNLSNEIVSKRVSEQTF